ncbi:MAG: hypothetical protein HYY42_05135 [Chloroflexi bacterium]|nr:hypothetical protein [Chloroflexota bacterium]
MTGRAVFMLLASAVFAVVLLTAVVRPAVERGGAGELLLIAGAFGAILLVERWLRTR